MLALVMQSQLMRFFVLRANLCSVECRCVIEDIML